MEEKEKNIEKLLYAYNKIPGYVYFINIYGTNLVKIGYSRNIESRIKSLQKQNFNNKLVLLKLYITDNPKLLEEEKHKEYKIFKIPQSEWFYFPSNLFSLLEENIINTNIVEKWYTFEEPDILYTYFIQKNYIPINSLINGFIIYGQKVLEKYHICSFKKHINRIKNKEINKLIKKPYDLFNIEKLKSVF